MNSFNHYSMGSVGEWLYRYVGGIDLHPDAVAYKKMIIHPRPNRGLKFANAEYLSVYGLIKSGWKITARRINLEMDIPANTTAIVYVPTSDPKSVRESGSTKASEVKFLREEAGCAVFEIGSGRFFISRLSKLRVYLLLNAWPRDAVNINRCGFFFSLFWGLADLSNIFSVMYSGSPSGPEI